MAMTKKDLMIALKRVPGNALVFVDLGGGELRGVHAADFDPKPLPDTDHPMLTLDAREV